MPLNNEALERLSRKSSHAYKPREGVEINRASAVFGLDRPGRSGSPARHNSFAGNGLQLLLQNEI